jgi:hypothetical protein
MAMFTRTIFLVRPLRIVPILLCAICFLALAQAQHGGGGGHSGGGHFGGFGGHSSGSHSSASHARGHFGWLHFGFGKHGARHAELGSSSVLDTPPHLASGVWNVTTPARVASIPPTLLWSPRLFPSGHGDRVSFVSPAMRPHRAAFFKRFPRFASSGCLWNGVSQICFFEPFFPLLYCSADFGFSYFGYGGDSFDLGDGLDSQGLPQPEMSEIVPPPPPSTDETSEGNSLIRSGVTPAVAPEDRDLGNGVFLLVLNNGASHAVIDYWVADGYLEYISPDGTRSHVPLEALDLQDTVNENAPRGLAFVLRSARAQSR